MFIQQLKLGGYRGSNSSQLVSGVSFFPFPPDIFTTVFPQNSIPPMYVFRESRWVLPTGEPALFSPMYVHVQYKETEHIRA